MGDRIAMLEARQETMLARLEGKIDSASGRDLIVFTVVASALFGLALTFAMSSYAASTFVAATTARDVVHNEVGAIGGTPSAALSKP